MSDPFSENKNKSPTKGVSGMVDYWIDVTPHDSTPNILDRNSDPTVGVAIRLGATGGTVAYEDRHGNAQSDVLDAYGMLPTSVSQVLSTGTDGGLDIRVAIAP